MPMIDVAILGAEVVWREHRTSDRVVPLIICTMLRAFVMTILACLVHFLTSFLFPCQSH